MSAITPKSAKTPAHPGRSIAILAVAIIAFSLLAIFQGTSIKLGLDLRGGTSVTLQPRASQGGKITSAAIDQAVGIIRQRVNSLGVAESEVSAQGSGTNRQIVISVPGETGRRIVDLVGQTAELRFRQVLASAPATASAGSKSDSKTATTTGVSAAINAQFAALDCTKATNRQGGGGDAPTDTIVACDRTGVSKYILAPAEVLGSQVSKATAAIDQQGAAGWYVILNFNGEVQQVSPTLGADQLHAGLLAGGLGLILVLIYSLLYYRGLGLVSVGSLVVAGGITYLSFLLLGKWIGFTLTLAGIAGAIVSIGITADSFVVYFERLRDEVREGRSLRTAVETGWARAKHTIIVADFVSLIAAILLYFFAVGSVRGFAFTLGLTTIVDLVVVFLFTHPLVSLLGRVAFFAEGHSLSGFSPRSLGLKLDSTSTSQPSASAEKEA